MVFHWAPTGPSFPSFVAELAPLAERCGRAFQVAKLGVRELLCIHGGLIAAERLAAVEVLLPRSGLPLWPLQHSFVRKTAFQTANRPHRKAAAPRRESAASLAAPRHVSVTVVKLSQLAPAPRRGRASSRSSAAYPSPLARSASLSIVRLPVLAMSTLWNLCGPCASASVAVLL